MYLTIDIAKTKQQITQEINNYNARMKEEHPDNYKEFTVKSNQAGTLVELAVRYSRHAKIIKAKNLNPETPFKINGEALASGRNAGRTTIWRHIERLEEAGLLRHLHSGKKGVELELNPVYLVPQKSRDELNYLALLPEDLLSEALKLPLAFTAGTTSNVSFCNLYNKIDNNKNKKSESGMDCAVQSAASEVLEAEEQHTHPEEQTAQPMSVDTGNNNKEQGSVSWVKAEMLKRRQNPDQERRKQERAAAARADLAKHYAELALTMLLGLLYEGRSFRPEQINAARNHLKYYLTSKAKSQGPDPDLQQRYDAMMQHFHFKKRHLDRNNSGPKKAYVLDPDIWLDPFFESGYTWTKAKYEEYQLEAEKPEEWKIKIWKICSEQIKAYLQAPDESSYRRAEEKIMKDCRNKDCLQFFYLCAEDPRHFNFQSLTWYRNGKK